MSEGAADVLAIVLFSAIVTAGILSAIPSEGGKNSWGPFMFILRWVVERIALCALPWWMLYTFFWITGVWLPLWVVLTTYIWAVIALLHFPDEKQRPRSYISTVSFYAWFVLWIAHYAPQAHFPILGGH